MYWTSMWLAAETLPSASHLLVRPVLVYKLADARTSLQLIPYIPVPLFGSGNETSANTTCKVLRIMYSNEEPLHGEWKMKYFFLSYCSSGRHHGAGVLH